MSGYISSAERARRESSRSWSKLNERLPESFISMVHELPGMRVSTSTEGMGASDYGDRAPLTTQPLDTALVHDPWSDEQ